MSAGRHHNLARDTLRLYASFGALVDRSGYGGREMLIFGMFVWNSTSNSHTDLTTYQTTHQIVKTGLPCSHHSGLQWTCTHCGTPTAGAHPPKHMHTSTNRISQRTRTRRSTCTHPLIEIAHPLIETPQHTRTRQTTCAHPL